MRLKQILFLGSILFLSSCRYAYWIDASRACKEWANKGTPIEWKLGEYNNYETTYRNPRFCVKDSFRNAYLGKRYVRNFYASRIEKVFRYWND